MENLIIGEGPLEVNQLIKIIAKSSSFSNLLQAWKRFSRCLEVSETKILDLERKLRIQTIQLHDIPHDVLISWKAQKGSAATLKVLCDAFASCEMGDVSESLEGQFWLDAVKKLRVKLHENVLCLEKLLQENASKEVYESIYSALKATTHKQPIPLLKEDVIPNVATSYYIPRTLSYMTQVDEKIFRADLPDHIFIVKGIGKHELAKLSGYKQVEVSGHQLNEITVRFIVLEYDKDFDQICRITKNAVHLIEHKKRSYFWKKSSKDLDKIQRFLKEEEELYNEEDLIAKFSCTDRDGRLRAVSISDSPGMGKTFLLTNLASKLKTANKSTVVLLALNEFVKQTKTKILSTSSALAAMSEYVHSPESGIIAKIVIDVMLQNCDIDIFLDGYDEVVEEKQKVADVFIKTLLELKHFRLFVTTRPHLRPHLEKILSLSSYEIQPFDESNQIEFLSRYWVDQYKAKPCERLERYAQKCLKTLREELTDIEMGIAGIPLQCRMLADVFAEDAKRATVIVGESTETIKITSLFDVYKRLIDLKFGRLPENSGQSFRSWFRRDTKLNYINSHIHDSIALLFPSWVDKFKPHLGNFQQINENILFSIGLVEKSPNLSTPRFVHRTFAEYLFAEYLVKNLGKLGVCVQMLYEVILGGEGVEARKSVLDGPEVFLLQNSTIVYFVNMHLTDQIKCNPLKELAFDVSKQRNKISFENVCKSLVACGSQDFETCFDLSLNVFHHLHPDHDNPYYLTYVRDKYFKHLPHLTVQGSKSVSLVEKVLELTKQGFKVDLRYHVYETDESSSYFPWISGCTPLHVAVYYGKYNIFTLLLDDYGDGVQEIKYLLHMSARYSSNETEAVIQDKLSIAEVILSRVNCNNLLKELLDDRPPLLELEVHPELLRCFVSHGADINAYSKHGTILHTSGNRNDYNDLLRWAISVGFKFINHTDSEGRTPLLNAAIKSDVVFNSVTLDVFKDAGANFEAEDNEKDSVLFHALRAGKSAVIIEMLIDYGANVNHQNAKKHNAAHVLMEESYLKDSCEALEKLQLLISKNFVFINQPDLEDLTPFALLVKNVEHFDNPELFELFRIHGIDFNEALKIKREITAPTLQPNRNVSNGIREFEPRISSLLKHQSLGYKSNANAVSAHETHFHTSGKKYNYKDLISWAASNGMNLTKFSKYEVLELFNGIDAFKLDQDLETIEPNPDHTNKVTDWTVLLHSIGRISLASIAKLVEFSAKVDYVDEKKQNAAHAVILNAIDTKLGLSEIIDSLNFLLSKGFNKKINQTNQFGHTPLYLAMRLNYIDLMPLIDFFQKCKADFNAVDDHGTSLILSAIEHKHNAAIIRKLVECGANLYHVNENKTNALHFASRARNISVLEFVIDKFDINTVNKYGRTTLYQLVMESEPIDLKLLDLFYSRGADFNAAEEDGWSILLSAIDENQNVEVIKKLIDYGADLYHLNSNKANALHIVAHCRNLSVLEFIIDKFDINSVNEDGETTLDFLVSNKEPLDLKLLDLFHDKGGNFNAADNNGWSILLTAIKGNQNASIISKIIDYGADLYHLNSDENNALHIAAENRNILVLEFVIDKFDIDAVNNYGETPLYKLVANPEPLDLKLLELFQLKGANFNAVNKTGWSVLLCAIDQNHNVTIIEKLIHYGADLYHFNSNKETALHIAAYKRNSSVLEFLIDKFDIDSVNQDGETALDYLVSNNEPLDSKLLELFYKTRANFNATNNDGWSILLSSIKGNQNAAILSKLIEYGADLYHIDLYYQNALHIAAEYRNVSVLEFVIDKFNINAVTKNGHTPLHNLVSKQEQLDPKLLKLFYEKGANCNAVDNHGWSILLRAIEYNQNATIISKLLEYGADLFHLTPNTRNNALHIASRNRCTSALQFIIDKLDINSVNKYGETALHLLLLNKAPLDLKLLDLFFVKKANFKAVDNKEWSVLLFAIQGNQDLTTIHKLIEYGADLYRLNSYNNNALHIAASHRNASVMEFLMNKFDVNSMNKEGHSPLIYLVSRSEPFDPSLLDLFQKYGANFSSVDNNGWSVLPTAIQHNNSIIIIRKLVHLGADLYYLNSEKKNALHIAARKRNYLVIEFLIDKFDINSVDIYGQTPLFQLVFNPEPLDPKMLDLFYVNGANFNAADNFGWSILLCAIQQSQNLTIVKKLIGYGADLYHLNSNKANALHIAARSRNVSVLEFLMDKFDINAANLNGESPLIQLVINPEPLDLMTLDLFHSSGANFNAVDSTDCSVLFHAVKNNQNAAAISKLVECGADLYHVDKNKANALHIAAYHRNSSALEFLIGKLSINARDKYGKTPLHHLVSSQQPLDPKLLELFKENGAEFNAFDNAGWSILHYAVTKNQDVTVVNKLVESGADLYFVKLDSGNALHVAAYNRNSSVLEYFLEKFDIDCLDGKGRTPLHLLLSKTDTLDPKLLELFREKGADFNAANKYESVLFLAIRGNQNATIVSKIIEYGGDPYYLNFNNNNAILVAAGNANFPALEFLLNNFKQDIDAVDNDGDTPLHEIFARPNKDYRDVLKLLLNWGCTFNNKNKAGYGPLVRWIIEGNNPIPTILELQNLLPITSEIACDALTALVGQETLIYEHLINSAEEKCGAFIKFFSLLIEKGGKLARMDASQINSKNAMEDGDDDNDHIVLGNERIREHIVSIGNSEFYIPGQTLPYIVPIEVVLEGFLTTKQFELFRKVCLQLKSIKNRNASTNPTNPHRQVLYEFLGISLEEIYIPV